MINLDRLDDNKEADVLCVVINIYSGESSFRDVKNCFARLVDDRNKELCRFNLSSEYNTQAMIMCHVEKRKNGCWGMITDGIGCSGNMASDSVNDAMKILRGEYQNAGSGGRDVGKGTVTGNNNSGEREALMSNESRPPPQPISNPDNGGCCCVVL